MMRTCMKSLESKREVAGDAVAFAAVALGVFAVSVACVTDETATSAIANGK